MKVALVTGIISKKSGARAPLEIAKALKKNGVDVTVFAYKKGDEKETIEELKIHNIPIILLQNNKLTVPLSLASQLRSGKFDVVSLHASFPFFIGSMLSGVPIVKNYYGTQFDPILDQYYLKRPPLYAKAINRFANIITQTLESIMLQNSKEVITISRYTKHEVEKLYGVSSKQIYLGTEVVSTYKKRKKAKRYSISILSVSRIVPYKGFHTLIQICNRLHSRFPRIKLIIAGSSPDKRYLLYLRKLQPRFTKIITNASDKQLMTYYQNADIYVSLDRYPFFGMPITEAASFGIPCIALDRCAAKEVIRHGKTGYVAKDEKTFSNYLAMLMKNAVLRKKMGREAKKYSLTFSWDSLANQYLRIFKHLKMSRQQSYVAKLFFILILGLVLRLIFLNGHEFWFDEAFSYYVSSQPVNAILRISSLDTHPPLYYLLLKLWTVFSTDTWFLRLPSLLLGTSSIILMYIVSKSLSNPKTALLATLLFTFSPLHIYFSTETRMYALLLFESFVLIWFLLRFIKTNRWSHLLGATIIGIFSLYTHYYSFLILTSLTIIMLLQSRRDITRALKWIITLITMFLAILPWLSYAFLRGITSCWCFHPVIGVPSLFTSFAIGGMGIVSLKEITMNAPNEIKLLFACTTVIFFLLMFRGVLISLKKKHFVLVVLFFTPLTIASFVGLFFDFFSPRSLIIIAPFYYVFVALGVMTIKNTALRNVSYGMLIVFLISVLSVERIYPLFIGPPLEESSSFVRKEYKSGDIIYHLTPLTLYPFLYFQKNPTAQFLTPSGGRDKGGIFEDKRYDKPIEKSMEEYKGIWVVTFYPWTEKEQIESTENILSDKFSLDIKKQYNTIGIYHYAKN